MRVDHPMTLVGLFLSGGDARFEDGKPVLEFRVRSGKVVRVEGARAVELAKVMVDALRAREALELHRFLKALRVDKLDRLEELARSGR
ncbi:hypothetical protein [Thermofilum pendens]|uniref:Uncharacterized protein n=1 Tax=Thermofilum pendens (strain DSM 2475 / Hrk 5) TaxID=368408 RepID=A1RZS2_THEPD|nr:hypothetical protein [Thermofilum pendens]ABL78702.1 hypothetical protein Tpen_1304 [Thermofilum pendens Hrk 5]